MTSRPGGSGCSKTCLNHVFQELTPLGVVVGIWDTSLQIPPSETTQPWRDAEIADTSTPDVYDPWHYNSVEWTGDGFIISFRHLDAIYKIDSVTPTGSIEWKLGGTPRSESLALVDDPLDGISGQHDARWRGDKTVTIHDNGTNGLGPMRQPRAVRYAVDTSAQTATFVEAVRDSGIASSFCCGSTRLLPTGNWVTGWGGNNPITENAPDGTQVFRLRTIVVYRGIPLLPASSPHQSSGPGWTPSTPASAKEFYACTSNLTHTGRARTRIMTTSTTRNVLSDSLGGKSAWRRQKTEEHPDDVRNELSAAFAIAKRQLGTVRRNRCT